MSPSAYGFEDVWVHTSDGTECNDPDISSSDSGTASCYAHEEDCAPVQTKVYEVHGNDGASHLKHAENLLKKESGNYVVMGSNYADDRCDHGHLLVEVTYYERENDSE